MLNQSLVVVTGGSRGIGRVYAQRLAESGARVVITGRDSDSLARAVADINHNVHSVAFDVTDPAAVEKAFAHIEAQHGPIDTLINNAGVCGPVDYFWMTDYRNWFSAIDINLKGTAMCTYAALNRMISRKQGKIINIVSNAGAFRWPTCSSYSVSKAAIIKLTENLAVEARAHRVALFAFHPGLVHSVGMSIDALHDSPPPESAAGRVLEWFLNEKKAGRTVDAEQGARHVIRLCSGHYGDLSGCYLTAHDDLDQLLIRHRETTHQDSLVLRINRPV